MNNKRKLNQRCPQGKNEQEAKRETSQEKEETRQARKTMTTCDNRPESTMTKQWANKDKRWQGLLIPEVRRTQVRTVQGRMSKRHRWQNQGVTIKGGKAETRCKAQNNMGRWDYQNKKGRTKTTDHDNSKEPRTANQIFQGCRDAQRWARTAKYSFSLHLTPKRRQWERFCRGLVGWSGVGSGVIPAGLLGSGKVISIQPCSDLWWVQLSARLETPPSPPWARNALSAESFLLGSCWIGLISTIRQVHHVIYCPSMCPSQIAV